MDKVTLCAPAIRAHQWKNLDDDMVSILTNKTSRIVQVGRNVIGQVVQVDKWVAYTPNKLRGQFRTRKEAVEWVKLMYDNPEACTHLARIRNSSGQQGSRAARDSFTAADTDNGFFNVLKAFAEGLGYTVSDRPRKGRATRLWGSIRFRSKWIMVLAHPSPLFRASVLAHELAHHFEYDNTVPFSGNTTREPVIEAVACSIMHDHGLDSLRFTTSYFRERAGKRTAFTDGQLDKEFVVVYTAFSEELEKFLSTR
jgi:hypothetical protein